MLDDPILYTLTLTLVYFIWQGCLVALFLKLALTFIPSKNASARYNLGLLALLANLLFPMITFYSLYKVSFGFQTNSQAMISSFVKEIGQATHYKISANLIEYIPLVTILWFIGVAYLALKLIVDLYKVNQLASVDVFAVDQSLFHRFNKLVSQMNLFRTPTLFISLKAEIPMALGWLKPVVLLPASMLSGLSSTQLEMLLLHELAHIQRHDYLVNFIQTIVEILLFFHPAVRWVSKQIRNEREYCSDDVAIHHCCNPIAYARALTETVSLCQHQQSRQSIPQMALAASGGDLKQRVIRIVDSGCLDGNDKGRWLAGVFMATTLFLISCHQLLTFSHVDNNLNYLSAYLEPQKVNDNDSLLNAKNDKNKLMMRQQNRQQQNKVQIAHHSPVVHTRRTTLKSASIHTTSSDYLSSRLRKNTDPTSKRVIKKATLINKPTIQTAKNTNNEVNKNDNVAMHSINKQLNVSLKTQASLNQQTASNNQANIFDHFQSPNNPYASQILSLASSTTDLKTSKLIVSENKHKQPVEKLAQIISSLSPKYPELAERKRLELEVLVHFTVDTQGYVRNIQIVDKHKVSYFRRSIRLAMKKWRFKPAELNGKPVESSMSRLFSFSLAG